MTKAKDEAYKYLVVEVSCGEYFGFNMKIKKEQAIAIKIMTTTDRDDFMIVGWKASKILPDWVLDAEKWIDFFNSKKKHNHTECFNGTDNTRSDEEDDDNEIRGDNENKEDEEVNGENYEEFNVESSDDDEEDEAGEEVQGEQEDIEISDGEYQHGNPFTVKTPVHKKANLLDIEMNAVKNPYKTYVNDGDVSIFASLNKDDLKTEVAKSVRSSMKTDTVEIFITGPFRNENTGKSCWVAVFGDNGSAWTLKAQFVRGYISTLLTKIKKSNLDNNYADSYYDINIRKSEYGEENLWKRKDQKKTIKRLSFVFTCMTSRENNGKEGLIEAIQFFLCR